MRAEVSKYLKKIYIKEITLKLNIYSHICLSNNYIYLQSLIKIKTKKPFTTIIRAWGV